MMPRRKDGKTYIHKTVTITDEQATYLETNSISLSKFVQNRINEEISAKKGGKA
jgi:hypothetical protein